MNIHEYQAKALLAEYGVCTLEGEMVHTARGATRVAERIGGSLWVVKAQIHAGGRGKAGGIKVVNSLEAVREVAADLLGSVLVTSQTGAQGSQVRRLYIESGCDIAKEFYLSMLVDRDSGRVAILVSSEGGMDIEEVAQDAPEKILKVTLDPAAGYQPCHGRRIATRLGLTGAARTSLDQTLKGVTDAFFDLDCSQIEINPLVLTKKDKIVALDAKMNFDDNALFRQSNIAQLRDEHEEDPTELEASGHGLSYIKLDGNIGCLVNGAGLAMATMDVIALAGGSPANFLDVGGGASKERVATAFKIVLSDKKVEGILVNIFGGIMRCDVIAEGIVAAVEETSISVPLVVRLEGTNVELGQEILSRSSLNIISAEDMGDAAKKIVAAVKAPRAPDASHRPDDGATAEASKKERTEHSKAGQDKTGHDGDRQRVAPPHDKGSKDKRDNTDVREDPFPKETDKNGRQGGGHERHFDEKRANQNPASEKRTEEKRTEEKRTSEKRAEEKRANEKTGTMV